MAMPINNNKMTEVITLICEKGFAGMGDALQILFNEAMLVERSNYLQAAPYERSEVRRDYANGFKPKQLKTQVGELNLQIPQVRSSGFYPSFLEKGLRSERALLTSLAEMYVQGVSTRKVNAILQELCGLEVSSSDVSRAAKSLEAELSQWKQRPLGQYVYIYFDAIYEKVRQEQSVVDSAVLIAYGVTPEGQREILGLSVSLSEAEIHWRQFLESLCSRGLHGIRLIVSDAHSGLRAALKAVFPSIPWQRCQFHLQQNAQSYVTKASRKKEVAQSIRAIFNAENRKEAERLLKLSIEKYEKDMPRLAGWMEDAIPEGLSIFQFPVEHHRRIRTSNIAERVNEEIRRRTKVVRIFPNPDSCERLVGCLIMELSEKWLFGKTYLTMTI